MTSDAEMTREMWEEFELKHRAVFPPEWEIKLYDKAFFRAIVYPDRAKDDYFILGLGWTGYFYERARLIFEERLEKGDFDGTTECG